MVIGVVEKGGADSIPVRIIYAAVELNDLTANSTGDGQDFTVLPSHAGEVVNKDAWDLSVISFADEVSTKGKSLVGISLSGRIVNISSLDLGAKSRVRQIIRIVDLESTPTGVKVAETQKWEIATDGLKWMGPPDLSDREMDI